ncbi:Pentatricopeptide repeat-containing protein, mitochondrial [Heracleum sosnowskyi]|uniref:Pentatricopeptide repeat-containing protein, mitochondrial n=1 Tax=Heracleum sosnowskyi TaxID=360622 RepID=A0AAD8HKN3_9APIA|nr:Pentatricopeptide repeat-containing protein, mitochondrial [Heracleum sosnowskyi]
MASFLFKSKLKPLLSTKLTPPFLHLRHFSPSILNPDSTTPLSAKEKSKAALTLIKSEKNPETILEICRAASLTPDSHLDRLIFSKAISKLSESNYYEGIREFLNELQTRPDLKTERFVSHCMVLYGEAGLLGDAVKVYDKMPELGIPRTTRSLNALLFSCIVANDYGEMKRIFVEFPKMYGIEADVDTYNTVIKGFCDSGSAKAVYSVLAEMDRKKCKPNATTFGIWIAGFYKEEKFDDVQKVLEEMKKRYMFPGISTFNIRIQSLCKLRRANDGKALLDEMFSRGMKPNKNTYYHLIHGFSREGKMDEAKEFYKKMNNAGYKPDSECYFTLVYFLCKNEDFETALSVCKESMEKNWFPSYSTMKLLVNGLASIAKVDEALELVKQMKERFPSSADQWNEIEESLPKK